MLQRLIGEVRRVKRIGEVIDIEVEIKDRLIKTKLPRGLKGKRGMISRRFMGYLPKQKDSIILTEAETRKFLKEEIQKREIIENRFLKIEIWEELGARIGSLLYKPEKRALFIPRIELGKSGWIYWGGILDILSLNEPKSLWNKRYRRTSKGYEYKKGRLRVLKRITLLKDLPAILVDYTITSGIKKKIDFGQYLMIPAPGLGQENILYLPLHDRIEEFRYWRYISPWPWYSEYAGFKLDGFLWVNESKGICLGGFTKPERLELIRLDRDKKGVNLTFMFKREELKPGRPKRYTILYIIGDSFHIDRESITVSSNKRIIVRSLRRPSQRGLSERMIKGIGQIWIGYETLP